MEKKRKASYNDNNKVTVRNDFIKASYPAKMTATDLKLLRLVIAQCRRADREFFEYEFRASDISERFQMDRDNLYREAHAAVERLFSCNLKVGSVEDYRLLHIFKTASYKSGTFTMRLSDEVKELFLQLEKNFTNIPILPVLAMKGKNSIRIYELICQKFMSKYPYNRNAKVITISLEELRTVTDTLNKKSYEQVGHFKAKILIPSLEEIEAAADWKIEVKDLKRSRKVTGFELTVWDRYGYELVEKYKREGTIPPPDDELPGQMSIFDYSDQIRGNSD